MYNEFHSHVCANMHWSSGEGKSFCAHFSSSLVSFQYYSQRNKYPRLIWSRQVFTVNYKWVNVASRFSFRLSLDRASLIERRITSNGFNSSISDLIFERIIATVISKSRGCRTPSPRDNWKRSARVTRLQKLYNSIKSTRLDWIPLIPITALHSICRKGSAPLAY